MKKITIVSAFIVCSLYAIAQKQNTIQITKYYDYEWKPCESIYARFAALIAETDSGWVRRDYFVATKELQMIGKYKDSACKNADGFFYFFYPNGKPSSFGKYINNKREGTWLSYHYNGMMSDSTTYSNGNITGISLKWYPDGSPSDSAEVQPDGSIISVGWFLNGNLSHAGIYKGEGKQGKWKYYHSTGFLSAEEWYEDDELTDKKYYDEDGVAQTDTTSRDRDALFKTGDKDWRKYVARNAEFPYQYRLDNTDKVTAVANYTVDETGTVTDIWLSVPVHPAFDREILNAIKLSEWGDQ